MNHNGIQMYSEKQRHDISVLQPSSDTLEYIMGHFWPQKSTLLSPSSYQVFIIFLRLHILQMWFTVTLINFILWKMVRNNVIYLYRYIICLKCGEKWLRALKNVTQKCDLMTLGYL